MGYITLILSCGKHIWQMVARQFLTQKSQGSIIFPSAGSRIRSGEITRQRCSPCCIALKVIGQLPEGSF